MILMEMLVAGMLFGMEARWKAALDAIGKPMKQDPATFALFFGMYFLLGMAGAWLYAAIRPRYGAGPKTAVRAGLAVWVLSMLLPQMVNLALNIYPASTLYIFIPISLLECVLAVLVAGWIYKEGGASSTAAA